MVELLVRAFAEDPAFLYMLPRAASRAPRMRWLFQRWLRARESDQILRADSGVLVGVAPGGRADVPFWTQLKLGLLAMPFVFGAGSFRRFQQVDADVKRRHARELDGPHFIVDILAVDPAAQGRGVGTALGRQYLSHADQAHLPCYLITHNPKNLPFYGGLGFEVVNEGRVASDGPTAWSMRRMPP
jgi:GNAT superfamily N-acetyltransferase